MTGRRAGRAAARGLVLGACLVAACARGGGNDGASSTSAASSAPAAGAAAAHSHDAPPAGPLASGVPAEEGQRGREVFAQTCVPCHGERAEGTQLGPALAGAAAWKRAAGGTPDAVGRVVADGVPDGDPIPMPAYAGALPAPEIRAVSAYVSSLHPR